MGRAAVAFWARPTVTIVALLFALGAGLAGVSGQALSPGRHLLAIAATDGRPNLAASAPAGRPRTGAGHHAGPEPEAPTPTPMPMTSRCRWAE